MTAPGQVGGEVIVIHETGGEKYFEALGRLHASGALSSLRFVEASVVRKFAWDVIRQRQTIPRAAARAVRNARFRCEAPILKGKIIILALAPWDIRFPPYALLRLRNRLIYHTSWPYWEGRFVPRRYGAATEILKRMWLSTIADSAVRVVAVTAAAARGIEAALGDKQCTVIPHAVGDEFFRVRASWSGDELRVIFIGDLITSKGVERLPDLDRRLAHLPVRIDVVGDGPARKRLEVECSGGRIHVLGAIKDRSQLAALVGRSHVLVVPSQRTGRWEELFGMVIAEAMSAGLPVIASNHVGPRALIVPDVSGMIVSERDPGAFAAAIGRFFHEPSLWQGMSDACKERGRNFSLERVMTQWREVLC